MLRDVFVGRIFEGGYSQNDGGPDCLSQLSIEYKLLVCLTSIIAHTFLIQKITNRYIIPLSGPPIKPNIIEYFFGVVQIIVLILQFFLKIQTHRLIFIFNPCHVTTLMQAYVLLTPSSTQNYKIMHISIAWCFGAFLGVLMPMVGEIIYGWEAEVFHIQHWCTGIICPILLMISKRYPPYKLSPFIMYYAFEFFIIYQRSVLAYLSHITWANLNFTLCSATTDPWIPFVGTHYYYISEFYVYLNSYLYALGLYFIASLIKKVKSKVD
ncbi:hypothetical protein SteCoe_28070 [Stentor coeruleus]|uniref:Transmembrane protein n=1 Tax=Stentor coeruleus TaxID=5963 RepID=A0A1R2B970_9CILI|nr:hypothetical protein SteCoe_28070 [Stentor coeruleus]